MYWSRDLPKTKSNRLNLNVKNFFRHPLIAKRCAGDEDAIESYS